MTALLYGLIYICLAGALAACAVRARRYARAPLHLRWELYPVPHEEPGRAAHGGSRYEETDWWTRESRPNHLGDLRAMAAEIVLFKGLWRFNRKLWLWSYAFHMGLLLVLCAAVCAAGGRRLSLAFDVTGVAGCVLLIGGALGLLMRRVKDAGLRVHTTPADIFNLVLFIATAAMLLWSKAAATSVSGTEIARRLLTFNTGLGIPAQQAIALTMAALLVQYIPLTHMAHFIAKYFTYHAVRWDDKQNDAAMGIKIAEYLTYKPTWSAPHVGAGNGETWADVATKNPTKGTSK